MVQGWRGRRNEGNPMTSNIDFNISGTLGEVSVGENSQGGGNVGGRQGWGRRGRRRARRNREEEGKGWMQVVSPLLLQQDSRRITEIRHLEHPSWLQTVSAP